MLGGFHLLVHAGLGVRYFGNLNGGVTGNYGQKINRVNYWGDVTYMPTKEGGLGLFGSYSKRFCQTPAPMHK